MIGIAILLVIGNLLLAAILIAVGRIYDLISEEPESSKPKAHFDLSFGLPTKKGK